MTTILDWNSASLEALRSWTSKKPAPNLRNLDELCWSRLVPSVWFVCSQRFCSLNQFASSFQSVLYDLQCYILFLVDVVVALVLIVFFFVICSGAHCDGGGPCIYRHQPIESGASRIRHRKLLAVDKLLQAVPISVPPLLSGGWVEILELRGMWTSRHSVSMDSCWGGLPTNLPEICPPYMRASQGVALEGGKTWDKNGGIKKLYFVHPSTKLDLLHLLGFWERYGWTNLAYMHKTWEGLGVVDTNHQLLFVRFTSWIPFWLREEWSFPWPLQLQNLRVEHRFLV